MIRFTLAILVCLVAIALYSPEREASAHGHLYTTTGLIAVPGGIVGNTTPVSTDVLVAAPDAEVAVAVEPVAELAPVSTNCAGQVQHVYVARSSGCCGMTRGQQRRAARQSRRADRQAERQYRRASRSCAGYHGHHVAVATCAQARVVVRAEASCGGL